MKKIVTTTCLCAALIVVGALAANAQVLRTSAPGVTIDNIANLCSGSNGAGGATDTIAYTETGTISDVNVRVEIAHTFRSDIQMDLSYSGGGGTVLLAADDDGSSDDYVATFDSDAATACSDAANCGTSGLANTGPCSIGQPAVVCSPTGSLDSFDTLTSPGTWTMRVCDDAGGDSGTWNLWEMQVSGDGELPVELMGFSVGD